MGNVGERQPFPTRGSRTFLEEEKTMPLYRGIGDLRFPDVPCVIQVRGVMGSVPVNVASSRFPCTFPTFPVLVEELTP